MEKGGKREGKGVEKGVEKGEEKGWKGERGERRGGKGEGERDDFFFFDKRDERYEANQTRAQELTLKSNEKL